MCLWRLIFVAMVSMVYFPVQAQADKPVLQWFIPHQPPTFINRGPYVGMGFGDKTVAYFVERLPEYKHIHVKTVFARALSELENQGTVCVPALFRKPEREKFTAFSRTVFYTFSNRLIIRRDRRTDFERYLAPTGELQIERLLRDSKLTFGYVLSRSYSKQIDNALKAYSNLDNHVTLPDNTFTTLLHFGRIDFTFGFPYEVAYQVRILGGADRLISIPVEGEVRSVPSAIGCSNSEFGKRVVAKIDAIIAEAGQAPPYFKFYEEWLDEQALQDFRSYTQSIIE